MSKAVQDILQKIQRLPDAERIELEKYLALMISEAEWKRKAEEARIGEAEGH
jgi:hypothetical protein